MSIPGAASPLFLATTGAAGDFSISRSLRFNQPDSSFLNRTFGSSGNRTTWTWSGWVKRSDITTNARQVLFSADGGANDTDYFEFGFGGITDLTSSIYWSQYTVASNSAAAFRDPSAWYHVVANYNGTNLTFYVNSVQVLQSAKTGNLGINGAWEHGIGRNANSGGVRYFSGYLAEINFVDGSALDPTSFGQADDNGVWQAKDTSGLSFGTNGFRLKFADNSSNAALGTDSSGNSNTWTVNNLSVGAVSNPTAKQNFDVVTYSGNGGTQSISSLAFQPDFVWIKARNHTSGHIVYDAIRGTSIILNPNTTSSEANQGGMGLSAFNSNGFTVKDVSNGGYAVNGNYNYVAWCWKAGGAASSNSDGSITSSVSANTTYGFSVVTYTGSNSVSTVGHGLGATPGMYIVKRRTDSGYGWIVYHSAMGASNMMALQNTSGAALDFDPWNQTAPTSSVFTVNTTGSGTVNAASKDYVAYVWSEVAGFSKFGSVSAGSDPIVTTGFKPRFVMVKRTDSTGNWNIFDTARGGDTTQIWLEANNSGAENNHVNGQFKFLANGFQLIGPDIDVGTVIYAAFAATVDESAINDCFVDTPTNAAEPSDTGVGNEVVGNYCTWNPLDRTASSPIVLANGNLDVSGTGSSTTWSPVNGTISMSSGKWYWEVSNSGTVYSWVGIAATLPDDGTGEKWPGRTADSYGYSKDATKANNNSSSSYGTNWQSTQATIGVAFDADNGTLTFYNNGVSQGVAFTGIPANDYRPCTSNFYTSATQSVNFGQRSWAYTAPSGYKALNTSSLSTPTIADGSKYFDTKLYTGNGSTQTVSGYAFSPDFTWLKKRSSSGSHSFHDVIRGATKRLTSNTTDAETTETTAMTAFNSDGFSLGSGGNANASGQTFVGWSWDAGTSTVTNNDGSIASTVRANPSAGFSIINHVGTNAAGTFGHGLNVAPEFLIFKNRADADNWFVWSKHADGTPTTGGVLNSTNAFFTNGAKEMNSTLPTSSVIHVKDNAATNGSSDNIITYAFAPVAGYSAMGSYAGTGTSGIFVHTGMSPSWVIIKDITNGGTNWLIFDSERDPHNLASTFLRANHSGNEINNQTANGSIDFLSNGFTVRASGTSNTNTTINVPNSTVVWMAFAKNPFQANGGLAR